jgi:cell division septation protein DedD
MASTTTDDGFHEIQLNGKQLVFLFMAVTVVSVVIFLCGVLVGRGVRAERASTEPATSVPALADTTPAPPPPAAVSAPAGAPATANETLTYANRLAGSDPPKEQLTSPPAAAPPAPAPAPAPAKAAGAPPKESPAAAPGGPAVAPEPTGPGFAIQLAALRQRDEADGVARRLTSKGYPAYVMTPDAGAPAVFRVRVGKFKDRREADAVAARLQKEEQFNPWIVR